MEKLFAWGFLFVGALLAIIAGPSELQTLQMASRADRFESTNGRVTASFTQQHPKGPDTQVLEYEYVVAGVKHHGDNSLTRVGDRPDEIRPLIHRANGEDTVRVYYDPEDPSVSTVHRSVSLAWPLGILGFAGLCLAVGIDGTLKHRRLAA